MRRRNGYTIGSVWRFMAKDAILDVGNERIPRRPLPYFDEQGDDVGLIAGITSSGGIFRVAFLDTNQYGPHAMILLLIITATITGAALQLVGML